MSALVQLRYTWLMSRDVLEVKAGDKFGVFEVKEANENYVLLYNKEKSISLDQNTVQPLYGELKFKVADSSTALRFFPIFEHTIPVKPKVELKAASAPATTQTAASATSASSIQPSSLQAPPGAISTDTVQTEPPVRLQESDPVPKQLYWVLSAIVGLVTTGYLVLRKG